MRNVVIIGHISTMSNKNDSQFKQEVPTKTVYLSVNEENRQKLIDFGLTLYTPDDGEPFFAVKASRQISMYVTSNAGEEPAKLDMTTATGISIRTREGVSIKMNIVEGENVGNTFYRLQAIQVLDTEDIEEIKASNPFAME